MVTANCGVQSPVGAVLTPPPAVFFFLIKASFCYIRACFGALVILGMAQALQHAALTHPGPHLVPLVPNQGTSSQMKPPPILVG